MPRLVEHACSPLRACRHQCLDPPSLSRPPHTRCVCPLLCPLQDVRGSQPDPDFAVSLDGDGVASLPESPDISSRGLAAGGAADGGSCWQGQRHCAGCRACCAGPSVAIQLLAHVLNCGLRSLALHHCVQGICQSSSSSRAASWSGALHSGGGAAGWWGMRPAMASPAPAVTRSSSSSRSRRVDRTLASGSAGRRGSRSSKRGHCQACKITGQDCTVSFRRWSRQRALRRRKAR